MDSFQLHYVNHYEAVPGQGSQVRLTSQHPYVRLMGSIPDPDRPGRVISGPGVVLQDDFSGQMIDTSKWQVSKAPFEVGTGTFDVAIKNGAVEISGTTVDNYWPGASLKTAKSYVATKDVNLSFEVDRVTAHGERGQHQEVPVRHRRAGRARGQAQYVVLW